MTPEHVSASFTLNCIEDAIEFMSKTVTTPDVETYEILLKGINGMMLTHRNAIKKMEAIDE